jgi:hypothetical protein
VIPLTGLRCDLTVVNEGSNPPSRSKPKNNQTTMNQVIYKGDFAELHNMKRKTNGLYKLRQILILGFNNIVFEFVNENQELVLMSFRESEHYIKSVIPTQRPTKAKLC